MKAIILNNDSEWNTIKNKIEKKSLIIIFKFSPRCPISLNVERTFDKWLLDKTKPNIIPIKINVIESRDLSQKIAHEFNIKHESPQCIILNSDLSPIYSESHYDIDFDTIEKIVG